MIDRNGVHRPPYPNSPFFDSGSPAETSTIEAATMPSAPIEHDDSWPGDKARDIVVQANREAAEQHLRNSEQHRAEAERLSAQLSALSPDYEAKRVAFEEVSRQVNDLAEQQRQAAGLADLEKRASEALSAAAVALRIVPLTAPRGDVMVAAVTTEGPTLGRHLCPPPCRQPMRWTEENGYIHDTPSGEVQAGQLCQLRSVAQDAQAGVVRS
ncbi:hypothetical protein [Sphaerisporangium aureirubrum]|uniref:Uncharacterized protein n=1 Tax=Sphaerisporangium aureirubrum TaxID=1544736 RepID=A0ABW1NDT6_9ACTN